MKPVGGINFFEKKQKISHILLIFNNLKALKINYTIFICATCIQSS